RLREEAEDDRADGDEEVLRVMAGSGHEAHHAGGDEAGEREQSGDQEELRHARDRIAAMTSYRDSGVDIDAQDEALREGRHLARGMFTREVVSDIGSFGGLFRASFEGMSNPILVSSTDGVGTKLRVAQAMKVHDTVGYDLVCHCVNDILVQGARPLFFLDYYA